MDRSVEIFAAICFLIIGLSHVVQPLGWIEFFQWLKSRGRAGALVEGFLCLNFGAFIAAFHHVWTWPGIVLTLIGWAQVIKGTLRFVAPQVILRVYEKMTPERAWMIRVAGVVALGISGFLVYGLTSPQRH